MTPLRLLTQYARGGTSCSITALSLLLNQTFDESEKMLTEQAGFTHESGTPFDSFTKFMEGLGYTYHRQNIRVNSKTAIEKLPHEAILHFQGHVNYYLDGIIYDSWPSTRHKGTKQTRGYWWKP